jgi:hypothetical protein
MTAIMEIEIEPPQSTVMELAERIDAIEEAYEFMLAYAAQGRRDERAAGPSIRAYLEKIDKAVEGLCETAIDEAQGANANGYTELIEVLEADARKVQIFVRFVLARPVIGSQLIDNLNATIHLRALLTDLFLIDESLKARKA